MPEKTDHETPLMVLRYSSGKILLGLCACYVYMMVAFVFCFIAYFAHEGSIGRYLFAACAFLLSVKVVPMMFDIMLTDSLKLYRDRIEKAYKFDIKPKSFYFKNGNITMCDRLDCLRGISIRMASDGNWPSKLIGEHGLYHFFYWNYKDIDTNLEDFVSACESIGVEVKRTRSYLGIVMLICVIIFILDMFLWSGMIMKLFIFPVAEVLNYFHKMLSI